MKVPRRTLFLALIFTSALLRGQTIVPGGYVSGSWDAAGSPYLVQDDILVHPDSTLIIDAGSAILFSGKKMLEIQGQLLVNGTIDSPVNFDGEQDTTTWYGLFFNVTDTSITDSSILEHGAISHCAGHPSITIEQSSRIRISGFTVRYGDAFRGGGISCINSDPHFEDLLVMENSALDGAGISLDNSSPFIDNCTISQNTAYGAGGAMVIFDFSNPVINECQITGNQSTGSGGGIYINNADPVFIRCTISGNQGAIGGSNMYSGGGVSVKLASHPVFKHCIFEGNISYREGGGIASFSENEIINCLFKENYAAVKGGGVFISSGNLIVSHLTSCTFSDNDSPQGTALATRNHTGVLRNCILWHLNPSNPLSLIHLDAAFPLNVLNTAYSDIQNGQSGIELAEDADYIWGQGNIDLDPAFLPGSSELDWQSPCIEAGTPDTSGLSLPELDLAGDPRIVNERIDLGAFEYQLLLEIPNSKFQIPQDARIYPNPAGEWIVIDFGRKIENANVQISGASGIILKETEIKQGNLLRIHLQDLSDGIYFILIKSSVYNSSKKMIVKRLL